MKPKNTSEKKNNSGKIAVVTLIGGVLLSGIVSSFAPDDAGETSSADVIIAEATPIPDSRGTPVLESTKTSSPEPAVVPTPEPSPEPTATPTPEPTTAPTPKPTPEPTTAPTPEPSPKPTAAPTPEPTVAPTPKPAPEPTVAPTPEPAPVTDPEPVANIDRNNTNEFTYVLNTNTHKIHHPNCRSVATIKPKNYATTNKSVDELLGEGYTKCGNCWK